MNALLIFILLVKFVFAAIGVLMCLAIIAAIFGA